MINVALLLVCLLMGVALRQWKVVPADANLVLNQLLITVFIPALTLLYIPDIRLDGQFWLPVLTPWVVFLGGLLFFWLASRAGLRPDRPTLGSLQLTGGISSVSFVGFPLFELLYGKAGLAVGIVMSQAGTFPIAMTLGVALASWHTAKQHPLGQPSIRLIVVNMLRFPPFPVFVVAMAANLLGYRHPVLVRELLEKISSPFSVLALLSVGLQLRLSVSADERTNLLLGLSYKLLLAPLLVVCVMRFWLGRHDYVADLCVLGSAIGPMNTAAILAQRYRLNTSLAAQMVGLGIPLSLPILFLIYYLMER